MAQTSLIQVRVDENLKQNAEGLFANLGIDIPTAIRLFLKQATLRQCIPFFISLDDDFYNEYNMQRLAKSVASLHRGKTVVKTTAELEAMANE